MPPDPTMSPFPERKPLPLDKRRRLHQCFETARRSVTQGELDYAAEMFAQCVVIDPGSLVHAQAFLENLYKKYNKNKKGSKLGSFGASGARSAQKKAIAKKEWMDAIKAGLDALKVNPWDAQALLGMATVCAELGEFECQLFYLKTARDTNPKDIEMNRLSAMALAKLGLFSQAITCWHMVETLRPNDPEALRMISQLTIQRTLPRDTLVEANAEPGPLMKPISTQVPKTTAETNAAAKKQDAVDQAKAIADSGGVKPAAPVELAPEQRLLASIERDASELIYYRELAELYVGEHRWDEAEAILTKGLSASGGSDPKVREELENLQIQHAQYRCEVARQRADGDKTEEAASLVRQLKAELNRTELAIFSNRCDRNPRNRALRFELGLRLKRAGQYDEAIKSFVAAQEAVSGLQVALEIGECQQYLKQYREALASYESAIEASSRTGGDLRKKALYRGGTLAMGLKEAKKAELYLGELVKIDENYKDVRERLDKLASMHDKG